MADETLGITEEQAGQKWAELAPLIDMLLTRISDKDDFPIRPRSSLARDDEWASPFQVSHAVKACIVAGVDHLHACKVLIVDAQTLHLAAPGSLVRGCLENLATAYWMLHPTSRAERVTRCLRWHVKNAHDQDQALRPLDLTSFKPKDGRLARIAEVAQRRVGVDVPAVARGYTSTAVVAYADTNLDSGLGVLLPWRLCSGFAHGRPWASLAFAAREEHPTADPGVMTIRFTSDLTRALYLTRAAMNLVDAVLRIHEQRSQPGY